MRRTPAEAAKWRPPIKKDFTARSQQNIPSQHDPLRGGQSMPTPAFRHLSESVWTGKEETAPQDLRPEEIDPQRMHCQAACGAGERHLPRTSQIGGRDPSQAQFTLF